MSRLDRLKREYCKIKQANDKVLATAGDAKWTEEFWQKWWPVRVDQEAELYEQIVDEESREAVQGCDYEV